MMLDLLQPSESALHTTVFGKSGSGKTYAVKQFLYQAIKDVKNFGRNHRFVVIDPKAQPGDYDILAPPIYAEDFAEIVDSINENRITVIWPEYEYMAETIEFTIRTLFAFADTQPGFSATIVIDEAGEFISHQKIPPMVGKLAVQGRAKKLKGVFLNQRPLLNRKLDSQLQSMFIFDMHDIDADNLQKRWGIIFDDIHNDISSIKFSFYHINFMDNSKRYYGPIRTNRNLTRLT